MDARFFGVKESVRHKADLAAASATVLLEPSEDAIDLHSIFPSWSNVARRQRRFFAFHNPPPGQQRLDPSIGFRICHPVQQIPETRRKVQSRI
jgi:hypothetical protein